MPHLFKQKLAADELIKVFAIGRLPHPVVIDIFALSGGFDGFWIDQEHTGMSYDQILIAATAARANGFDCFVRMAPTDYSLVTQNLETGVGGVMAARIESADQAEEFVSWAKFAPRGSRGLNSSGADANYTFLPLAEFAERANRDHFVAIQIETLGALQQAEQIAAIDGVDMLFIGPADLSQALGVLGQINHEKVWEGYDHVAACCRKHGKHWGTVAATPDFADRCVERGCRMVTLGSDVKAVRAGVACIKQENSKYF